MTREDMGMFAEDVDICIREACGGWIVIAPNEFTDDGLTTSCHVFTDTGSVLEFVRQRMDWFKRERNKGNFNHGDDDYPGDPQNDPKLPTLKEKK